MAGQLRANLEFFSETAIRTSIKNHEF